MLKLFSNLNRLETASFSIVKFRHLTTMSESKEENPLNRIDVNLGIKSINKSFF